MGRLQDKVVIISGGARGQGAAEARLVVAEGGKAVIGDVLEAGGSAHWPMNSAGTAVFLRHDVTEEADWAKAVEAAQASGGLPGMVTSRHLSSRSALMELDAELFERDMRPQSAGLFLGMRQSTGLMERSGGGSIVNISSVAGLRGSPGASPSAPLSGRSAV